MALVKSMPAVANISCFLLLEWFIVAILGVQLFKGRFYLCATPIATLMVQPID